jgi:predicted metalloendopeptidase
MRSIGIISVVAFLIAGGDSMSLKGRLNVGSDPTYGTKLMSTLFKDSINTTVNPCQDFFSYVCDGYNRQHPIPDGVGHVGVNEDLQDAVIFNLTKALKRSSEKLTSQAQSVQTIYHIFDACVRAKEDDYQGAKSILNITKEFGGWPILDLDPKSWTPSRLPKDLSWIVGNIFGVHGIATLLTPQVDLDWFNVSSNNILYINQASLSTPAIYYRQPKLTAQTRETVRKQIEMTVRALANRTDETGELDKEAVKEQIEAMVEIEYELAMISTPDEDERNSSQQYNSYTVDRASIEFDSLDWTNYFAGLTAANSSGDEPPTDKFDQRFILTESKLYLPKLNRWLKTYNQDPSKLKNLINYLIYRLVSPYMLFAGPPLEDTKPMHAGETMPNKKMKTFGDLSFLPQALPSLSSSTNDVSDHEKNCANFIMGFAPYVAGRLYVDSSFPNEARADVAIMVGNVLAAFKGMLSGLDWIDEQSILRAYNKINNMIQSVGYPDFEQDDRKLDEYYKELIRLTKNVDPSQYEAFFLYVKTLVAYQMRTMFSQVLKPGDRYDFLMSPAVVNDWYQPERNSITFPAAQLAPPFYGFDFPKAINYGAFGATIGHEMTHGFDDEGVQYDYDGTLHTWMSAQSQIGFKKMAQCVVDEYNGFCYPETGACVSGVNTQGENIADNGGLKAAYQAYKAYTFSHGDEQPLPDFPNLTNDQIFFIAYGYSWCGQFSNEYLTRQLLTNAHAPYGPRVNGVVKNFAQFGQAFQCNKGDEMYPKTSCDVW